MTKLEQLLIEALGYVSWTDNIKRDEIMGKIKQVPEETVFLEGIIGELKPGIPEPIEEIKLTPTPQPPSPNPRGRPRKK